jgi:N-acetylmuramoyl-L-alanine amidase
MKRALNSIVIHCAATPNGKDFSIADIDVMHKVRKFKRDSQAVRNFNMELKYIGYHFVIEIDGSIRSGRGIEEIGAHVQGSNAKSIGICMIGTDKYTAAQWESLKACLIKLAGDIQHRTIATPNQALLAFSDMGIKIKGHRDFSPDLNGDGQVTRNEWVKTCPGFSVKDWLAGGMKALKESTLP